mmetsp:Transcript_26278/g.40723  ORF Transcript_26278/g.40723 Transcript_26278/m.40723 type:complete len:246 (-) Transcript_26278:227-964(-)|eukprot:CAMPEP_0196820848 /NCGR_PEP_ID=MMETSP1362-20130617/76843_1 /TAXON_ID=163516 /ORGANISM="Leptocylindrus danicus, Strain CCMP1856" /LENGTH=245 /DNA_ID=CAMNT_0042199861 /DNA_START=103 /DNA_END=840 /DNA_ORIENTATION=-
MSAYAQQFLFSGSLGSTMPQHANPLLVSPKPEHVLTSPLEKPATTRISSSPSFPDASASAYASNTANIDEARHATRSRAEIAAKVDSANVDTHKLLTQRNSGKGDTNKEAGAVRFNLTISSSGRTYTCVRTMLKFIELRKQLIVEVEEKSGIKVPELPLDFFSFGSSSPTDFNVPITSAKKFSGWGFSMLQTMVCSKVKLMEEWLSYVCSMMPTSPSLSKFLWEPMTDANGLGVIYESDENEEDD